MPRQARIDSPGALHHIMARGIERTEIFRDNIDRKTFLDRLGIVLSNTETQCFAWALMPNHFHLLLRTGNIPIATVMRRLLTGYAVTFNLRHERSGHLFQNRYKSILCQEDDYFLELVRYIHLNPIRAGLVKTLFELDAYPFTGHAITMGTRRNDWQNIDEILLYFDNKVTNAQQGYREFIRKGLNEGTRPDLLGGGLIRSNGGWEGVAQMRKDKTSIKSDERVLGDSNFVNAVLAAANEAYERKYYLKRMGYDLDMLAKRVSDLLGIDREEIFLSGKQQIRVRARSLFCYWAVRELGYTMTDLAGRFKMTQPAVSISVARGEELARERCWRLKTETED